MPKSRGATTSPSFTSRTRSMMISARFGISKQGISLPSISSALPSCRR
jgi:hypothetical protein